MSLKNKLKLKTNLKKKIENESAPKKDTRYLNFYDLKDGEKMKILFVPCAGSGELYRKWKVHGPNLGIRGVGGVRCSDEANQQDCPACQQGYALLNEGKEDGNDYEAYKEEAKKWFSREFTLAQCLVLEAPFEVSESPDNNEVKLIRLPWAIEEKIRESVLEGIVDEDDICLRPFVIKNTMNGKYNTYKNSFFHPKQVDDEVLEAFDDEDLVVEPYDLETIDVIPEETTEAEVEAWLEKAIAKYNQENGTDDDEEEEEKEPPRKKKSIQDRLKDKKSSDDDDDEEEDSKDEEEEEKEEPSRSAGASSLRERLQKARK